MTTINELIKKLEDAREELEDGGDAEVRIAYQQSWPLRGTVCSVTVPEEEDTTPHCEEHIFFIKGCQECELVKSEAIADGYDPDENPEQEPERRMLWLAVGSAPYDENPYAPRWAWGS